MLWKKFLENSNSKQNQIAQLKLNKIILTKPILISKTNLTSVKSFWQTSQQHIMNWSLLDLEASWDFVEGPYNIAKESSCLLKEIS